MSDYTKLTAFDTKDALTTGDPLKRIKGTELDDEFDAIAVAVATKANSASPSFTGTPTAPTAAYSTSTTQLATTAFVQAALAALYPVGSVYINAGSTENPATLLGFGTWTAFGAGKVLVGQDTGDTSFDTMEETGGSKDAVAVSHTHTATQASHSHTLTAGGYNGSNGYIYNNGAGFTYNGSSSTTSAQPDITVASAGESGTNKNLQPYVVVKMWKRTA